MDHTETVELIESGLFLLPELPGKLMPISIDCLQGRITPVSHHLANVVGAAKLEAKTADLTIRQVIELFAQENKVFGWRVGPTSTPADLKERLTASGFKLLRTIAGLALLDFNLLNTIDRSGWAGHFHIRPATQDDIKGIQQILRHAYPLTDQGADLLGLAFTQRRAEYHPEIGVHLVEEVDSGKPVAMGVTYFFPDSATIFLGGAATIPEYRGRGFYTNLVIHRIINARDRGSRNAVVQAVSQSASACRKAGFADICPIDVFVWDPKDS